jgi:hypothetical protein
MTTDDDTDPADVLDDNLLIDGQDDDPADLVADDRDDLAQDHRLNEILKTRRRVLEHRTQLRHAIHRGELHEIHAATEYRDVLESYLIDLEPVFIDSDKAHVWHREHIGTWTLKIPGDKPTGPAFRGQGTESMAREASVHGLSDILAMPNPITITQEMPTRNGTDTEEHEFQIPFELLDRAFRTANRALNDWGLELQLEPDDGDEWSI